MENIIFVAEGSHDVSFIGKLLVKKGFIKAEQLSSVPDDWQGLYPTKFPFRDDRLERVARFPDVYTKGTVSVGLINSGGDSKLVSSLRNALDMLGPKKIKVAVIFSDADLSAADVRFKSSQVDLEGLNKSAVEEGAPGYPVTVPTKIGVLEGTAPAIGVFVFPNNKDSGSLEDILIECSNVSHNELTTAAKALIVKLDSDLIRPHKSLKKMRAGLGKSKSIMGAIANVLRPGSSLAVAVEQGRMMPDAKDFPKDVLDLDQFLDDCLC